MNLSSNQVEKFLTGKLGFEDWQSKLNRDKKRFLKEFILRYAATMYYENITWGARKQEEWSIPTIPDVIEHILETAGGACIHLNYFIKLLLDNLGFDAYVVSAPSTGSPNVPDNHMVVIVRLPASGSSESKTGFEHYMIDLGCARPILYLVPLTEKPFIGKAGGFKFQYRLNPETGLYERADIRGCPVRGKFEDGLEELVTFPFSLSPKNFEEFDEGMSRIFTTTQYSFFLNTILLYRIVSLNVENTEDHEFDFEYVCCLGRKIVNGTRDTLLETRYDSYSVMLPDILKWFPLLNSDTLRQALSNYDQQRIDKN